MKNLSYIECNSVFGGSCTFLEFSIVLGVTSGIVAVFGAIIAVYSRVNIRPCTKDEFDCLTDDDSSCASSTKDICHCIPDVDSPDNH